MTGASLDLPKASATSPAKAWPHKRVGQKKVDQTLSLVCFTRQSRTRQEPTQALCVR